MLSFSHRNGTLLGMMIGCSAMFASTADAGITTMNLSGGWQATWDSSLDPYLDLNDHGVIGGALFIEKTAQFTQAPVNGVFPSIDITFTQIAPDAVANIVIDDEIITNSTGSAWDGFKMDLFGFPNVAYDTVASTGFSVGSAFATSSFTNGNQTFNAFNGSVANGSTWFPGVISGQLWIDIFNLSPTSNISFVLSERPTPAPGAVGLLAVACLAGGRRRRS